MKRTINLSPGRGTLLACVLFLISIALAALPCKATAQTIYKSEGLNFTLNPIDHTATVGATEGGTIARDLIIPEKITYNETEYTVTAIANGGFKDNTSINSVVIPFTVKKIDRQAFQGSTLTSVTLNEGLEIIDYAAFFNCNITEVTIPASVTSIGNYALYSSSELSVTCLGSTPATFVGSSNFNKLKQIRVPAGAVDAYKAADGWSTYESIIQAIHPTSFTDATGFTYTLAMSDDHTGLTATLASCSDKQAENLEIPDVLKNNDGTSYTWNDKEIQVTAIASKAFKGMSNLKELRLPTNLKSIGEHCFDGCTNMTVYYNGDPAQISSGSTTDNANLSDSKYYPILIVSADKKAAFKNYNDSGSSWGNLAYIYTADELKTLCLTDATDFTTAISKDDFYKAGNLSYKRTFNTPGQYATTCLPFAINPADYAEELDIYRLTTLVSESDETGFALRMNETKIILSLEKTNSDDNKIIYSMEPLFVKAKEGVGEVTFKSVSSYTGENILKACELPSTMPLAVYDWDGNSGIMSKANDLNLTAAGTVCKLSADSELLSAVNIYTFNADGSFGRSDEVHAFRMFIATPKQSAQMSPLNISIGIEGETTDINGITDRLPSDAAADRTAPVYSLDGKMVSANGSTDRLKKGIYIKNKKKFVVK